MAELLALAGPTLVLGVLNFLIVSGAGRIILALTLGKRVKALRLRQWISTIPGNPTCLDPLLAVIFGSFPELNDFSSILPFADLSQGPVVLRGMPPRCRSVASSSPCRRAAPCPLRSSAPCYFETPILMEPTPPQVLVDPGLPCGCQVSQA